ncbi:hypothetical protein [Cellulomonas sp. ATA003]|uniref:hypothetical protein n=1 Tax=Cellulomonas sp. ATA003 TaxID=3073064 RepID=UPI002872E3E4|nr:hypothetical protein [Cellulomonas sp. ATA003]WNB85958.1 hypothetical protein REH70_01195 [Cellulomonas sp. ATA003]
MHAATVGLVGVLAALTVFSVTTAVTDARAAERAQVSAVVSAWSREALTALVLEENLVDQLKAPGPEEDGETAQEYLDARAAVDEALDGLRGSVTPPGAGRSRTGPRCTLGTDARSRPC